MPSLGPLSRAPAAQRVRDERRDPPVRMVLADPAEATTGLSLRRKARLGLEIFTTYAQARWWLWRADLPRAVAALRREGGIQEDSRTEAEIRLGFRLGRVVGRTLGVLPADSRCLVRSLVLTRLLARRGISSSLIIGVTPEPEFAAHAWVESNGIALLPSEEGRYGRLTEL
jgi:hypothetical protein